MNNKMSSTSLKKSILSLLSTLSSTLVFKSDGVHESFLKNTIPVSRPPYLKLYSTHSTRQTLYTKPEEDACSDASDTWIHFPCQEGRWAMAACMCTYRFYDSMSMCVHMTRRHGPSWCCHRPSMGLWSLAWAACGSHLPEPALPQWGTRGDYWHLNRLASLRGKFHMHFT